MSMTPDEFDKFLRGDIVEVGGSRQEVR